MSPDEALAEIRSALSDRLGVSSDRVVPTANLREDLELDSLDMAELVANLEDRTGHSIGVDRLIDVETVDDVVGLLCWLAGEAAADEHR